MKGSDNVESTTKSITAAMEIPDSHKMTVTIVANKWKTTVPYSATLTKTFYDGSKSKHLISGIYKGVNIDEVKVEYGEITPLASVAEGLLRRRRETNLCGDGKKVRFLKLQLKFFERSTPILQKIMLGV